MTQLNDLQKAYEAVCARKLNLDMQRGQPSDENFDLSNPMLASLQEADYRTPSGVDIRNYPGGIAGIAEARALFAGLLGVAPSETMVGNNASLSLMGEVLNWAMLRGLKNSSGPWAAQNPKMIVTVPGYDRHFTMLEALGIEMLSVPMTPSGPDADAVIALAEADASVKGLFFVPTYSNPTGDSIAQEVAEALLSFKAAAPDFTILADDAYRVHHLSEDRDAPLNLLALAKAAGNPERVLTFASTSKVTFAGAGLGYLAASEANIAYLSKLLGTQSIGPNKAEQLRHVKFLEAFPGGVTGLMAAHARILKPKFDAVDEVLSLELAGTDLATWTKPKGGYFISLDTKLPLASRVVELAKAAGVTLTPAGATYPGGHDPHNQNIRLAPTRPPLEEVKEAMAVVALCIKLAAAETER